MSARERRPMTRWEHVKEDFAKTRVGGWWFVSVASKIDPPLLKATRGRLSTAIGSPVLLLRTRGARSGQLRETPLAYATDGDRILLVASKAGSPKHPGWYHNLRAHPEVEVIAAGRSGRYRAREAEGEERARLWAVVNDFYAGYETYQGRAGARRIPVMVLERAP
jgi:deazaflavin-dependent oxidoreductase (nitroreductase family)